MLHRRLAAVDGLLAPLGSGKLSHTPPPHAQAPWPHAHSAQRQPSQASNLLGLLFRTLLDPTPASHADSIRVAGQQQTLDCSRHAHLARVPSRCSCCSQHAQALLDQRLVAITVLHETAHRGHANPSSALPQDVPAAAAPKLEGRSSRGPAAAPLGRTSDTSSRLKTEPLLHGSEPGALPSSAATMLAVCAADAVV